MQYHCIMSMYPMDKSYEVDVANSNRKDDVNVYFWEQFICFDEEKEFDDWVANNPWGHNLVMVVSINKSVIPI